MHSLPILDELPAGYFVEESPRGILAVHVDLAQAFHESGFGPEHDGPMADSDIAGRRPLGELEVGGQRFLVRRYTHGGMLRWINRARFSDASRPFRELILADSLGRSGVRTPQVAAARARLAAAGGWYLELVTRRVDNAVDLGEALELVRDDRVGRGPRGRLFEAAGALVRDLHRLGFLHADLTPRNVLVRREALDGAAPEPWIIDLEGSGFRPQLDASARQANLRRLWRSVERRESRDRPFLRRSDLARFFRGYDPEGRTWKADWRAVRAAHGRTQPLHHAGWLLERALGGNPWSR